MALPLLAFAGIQAAGQLLGGFMANKEAKTRAAYERVRAGVARDQAQAEIRMRGRRNIRERGRELAAMAQTGFTSGGNFLDLLEQSDIDREMDILNTAYRGELAAFGFESQARLDIAAGKNAMLRGVLGAAGTLGSAYIGSQTPTSALGSPAGGYAPPSTYRTDAAGRILGGI